MKEDILIDFLFWLLCGFFWAAVFQWSVLQALIVMLPVFLVSVYSDLSGKNISFLTYALIILVYDGILLPMLGI